MRMLDIEEGFFVSDRLLVRTASFLEEPSSQPDCRAECHRSDEVEQQHRVCRLNVDGEDSCCKRMIDKSNTMPQLWESLGTYSNW